MNVRTYRSTDSGASALTLNNTAGKLLAVLDAVLKNGYSVGTVSSIIYVGNVATINFTAAHGLADKGNMLTVSGCTGADAALYNGEFAVTIPSTTSASYTMSGTPTGNAAGSPAAAKAGSGWTKPYNGTNLAAYKQGSGSNGFYLYVDDTGTTAARGFGYETMSSISDTSGNAFPTAAQVAGGLYLPKSNGATNRAWIVVATEKDFYMWVDYAGTVTVATCCFFGDFVSYVPTSDIYNTAFLAGTAAGFSAGNGVSGVGSGAMNSSLAGNYAAKSYTNTGASIAMHKSIDLAFGAPNNTVGANGETYPSPVTGGLLYSDIYINEVSAFVRRGKLPGCIAPLHNKPLTHLDTFDGTGDLSGKTFLALSCYNSGQFFVEVSNTR